MLLTFGERWPHFKELLACTCSFNFSRDRFEAGPVFSATAALHQDWKQRFFVRLFITTKFKIILSQQDACRKRVVLHRNRCKCKYSVLRLCVDVETGDSFHSMLHETVADVPNLPLRLSFQHFTSLYDKG